jgi:cytochrome c biogenesis protein CcdA
VTPVGVAAAGPEATVVGYAFVLGLVGVANPCGLPLLPAYLSFSSVVGEASWAGRFGRWGPRRA